MNKLMTATFIILVLAALQSRAFANELHCKFTDRIVEGVHSLVIKEEAVIVNGEIEIPLEKSVINCSNYGRQSRFDGNSYGYQVILKSCTTEAKFEGIIIDSITREIGDISCS